MEQPLDSPQPGAPRSPYSRLGVGTTKCGRCNQTRPEIHTLYQLETETDGHICRRY